MKRILALVLAALFVLSMVACEATQTGGEVADESGNEALKIGVICIGPLTPILESPVLEPAFDMILPALFGGLAVVFISKNLKLSIAPIALMLILFIFVPALNASTVGIMVPVGVIFTVIVARILYKKGVL